MICAYFVSFQLSINGISMIFFIYFFLQPGKMFKIKTSIPKTGAQFIERVFFFRFMYFIWGKDVLNEDKQSHCIFKHSLLFCVINHPNSSVQMS